MRYLLAAHPHLLTPVLQVIHRAILSLIKQAGLKRIDAQTGAITLIQRFGSAANLNIHLHCLVLDGVYRMQNDTPEFHSVRTPTDGQLQALLNQIIKRIMKALTRNGALIEEEGISYLAEMGTDAALIPMQSAACTYRIVLGRRAGQVVLTLKTPYRDGTTHFVMSPLEFMQRLTALVPRPRLNLIRFASFCFAKYLLTPFHGVLAPNAKLRATIILTERKINHAMRMTMGHIPQLLYVSVGRAC